MHRHIYQAKVLIVEDNPLNLQLASAVLKREGYSVETAVDGDQAVKALDDGRIDLVLLDLHLPRRSGLDVLTYLRSQRGKELLPVVMLTASAEARDKLDAIKAGVTDFIQKPFDLKELTTRIRSLLMLKFFTDELENANDVLLSLAETIDARDRYTAGHGSRVAFYASLLGKKLKLGEAELDALKKGALFHDFGKISIRDNVLLKPGKLTPEEFEHIKCHPKEGKRLVERMRTLASALPIICHHHEKLDGSGYPDGLSGGDISVTIRITSIADVYDALTTDRPYRKALSRREALATLRDEAKKGWWDKEIVGELIEISERLRED